MAATDGYLRQGFAMTLTKHTPEEVARIAEEIYARQIRPKLGPQDKGKFLVLDIRTGEYEIDPDDLTASERLRERVPSGEYFGLRIGYTTSYTLGGRMEEQHALP
jgi:hypothetical protein